jgi:hypothetical protein
MSRKNTRKAVLSLDTLEDRKLLSTLTTVPGSNRVLPAIQSVAVVRTLPQADPGDAIVVRPVG